MIKEKPYDRGSKMVYFELEVLFLVDGSLENLPVLLLQYQISHVTKKKKKCIFEREENLRFWNQCRSPTRKHFKKWDEVKLPQPGWADFLTHTLFSSTVPSLCCHPHPTATATTPPPLPPESLHSYQQPPVLCCQWFDSAQSNYRGP